MDALLEELIKCVFEGAFDISFFFSPSDSSVAALQRATLWHTDTPAEAVCVVRQDRSKGLNAAGPESPSGKARLREAWGGLLQRAAKDEVATAKEGEEEEEEEEGGGGWPSPKRILAMLLPILGFPSGPTAGRT